MCLALTWLLRVPWPAQEATFPGPSPMNFMRGNPACPAPPGPSAPLPSRWRGAGAQVLPDKHCWESGLLRGAWSGSLELNLSPGERENTIQAHARKCTAVGVIYETTWQRRFLPATVNSFLLADQEDINSMVTVYVFPCFPEPRTRK